MGGTSQQASALPPIEDIEGPLPVGGWPPWLVVLALVVVAAALALVAWLLWRRWREANRVPPPTPREIAIGRLGELRDRLRQMDGYRFAIAVSDVLREFVGTQYDLPATRQTSPEFLAAVARSPWFGAGERDLLEAFLGGCDRFKFAREEASAADEERLLESAVRFVIGARVPGELAGSGAPGGPGGPGEEVAC